nr:hypothetical protein [uncultured Dongia sp.]
MKRMSLLIAGAALMLSAATGSALAETPAGGDRALQAVSANLPDGVTIENATERDLSRAVRRTVRAHPELSSDIVEEVSKVAPSRKQLVKKAVTAATTPYSRPYGRGGKP